MNTCTLSRPAFVPAFRQIFKNSLKGAAAFYLVLAAVFAFSMAATALTVNGFSISVRGSISGGGIGLAIFLFVVGVAGVRSDLRLCVQFGTGRRTAYLAEYAAMGAVALCLAAVSEVFGAAAQLIGRSGRELYLGDLYQLLYRPGSASLGFGDHMVSLAFNFCLMLACFALGVFFSLFFWRLRGIGVWAGAIGLVVLANVIPNAIAALHLDVLPLFFWLAASAGNAMLAMLGFAAVFAAIGWGLLRGSAIRSAAK